MKSRLKYVFYAAIIFTLLFIWGHSCMPPEMSGNESNAVRGFLERLIGSDTPLSLLILKYVRKIAHFTEFALLAFEMTLFTYICTKSRLSDLVRCVCFGTIVAIIDETIQIFAGRGSSVVDVLIDTSGYLTSFLLTSLLCFAVRLVIKYNAERKKCKNV